jgi:hypothetical protein
MYSVSIVCEFFFLELEKRPRCAAVLLLALAAGVTPELPSTESNRGKKWRTKRRIPGMHDTTMAKHISMVLQ